MAVGLRDFRRGVPCCLFTAGRPTKVRAEFRRASWRRAGGRSAYRRTVYKLASRVAYAPRDTRPVATTLDSHKRLLRCAGRLCVARLILLAVVGVFEIRAHVRAGFAVLRRWCGNCAISREGARQSRGFRLMSRDTPLMCTAHGRSNSGAGICLSRCRATRWLCSRL